MLKKNMILVGTISVAVVTVIYLGIWQYKSVLLSEAELSPAEKRGYENCLEISTEVSKFVDVPASIVAPQNKAIFCELRINLVMSKYMHISIYGIVKPSHQNLVTELIRKNWHESLPVKLVISEKENWRDIGSGAKVREKENKIFEQWVK